MNVLFLDIDGVLNRCPTKDELAGSKSPWSKEFENEIVGLNPTLVSNLKYIIDSIDLNIVFSTSWRYYDDHPTVGDDWRKTLAEMLKVNQDLFIGNTPILYIKENRRGKEIQKWINDNSFTGNFCVVDDDISDIINVISIKHVFKTDKNCGLTKDIAEKIISFFKH